MNPGATGSSDVSSWLRIDQASSVPPYEQLRVQILDAANNGSLPVGTRLPPVRSLASHLGVAVNTVARAYRELEQANIVVTRSRAGTVVAAAGDEARQRAAEAADGYADVIKANGLTEEEAVAYLRAALRRR
ncbi:GntR family transcriptional regulator [Arthrobacter sp. H20]|uniref:GntR family transcriptional regulator n=1 Tax=Arthrobacter sp. H20 TaxID=1267981 RepID=UPI0004B40169|nr:GntR family transcriptional regulator [Arthrobacter sp. H20]